MSRLENAGGAAPPEPAPDPGLTPKKDWVDRVTDRMLHAPAREQWAACLLLGFIVFGLLVGVGFLVPGGAQIRAWLQSVVFVAAFVGGIWSLVMVMKRIVGRIHFRYATEPEALRRMGWRDLELLTCELYRRRGYKVVHHSLNRGPDGGIDVIVEKDGVRSAIQCKKYDRDAVGVSVVRELYGVVKSAGMRSGVLITTSFFTDAAKEFAHENPEMVLIDGEELWEMVEDARAKAYVGELLAPKVRFEPKKKPRCPSCGEELVLKDKNGPFLGCAGFGKTQCGTTIPLTDARTGMKQMGR